MTINIRSKRIFWAISLPMLVFGFAFFLTWQSFFQLNAQLFTALTYDLILTAPLLYFLVIRKTSVPNLTVVPVFLLGLIIGSLIIPESQQQHLSMIKTYILPLLELLVVGSIIYKSHRMIKAFQGHAVESDFYNRILIATRSIIGDHKITYMLAFEITAFYYTCFVWKRKPVESNQYTSYKRNGIGAMLWALIMVLNIETVAVHLLLEPLNAWIAWLLTISSLYLNLQIFAHLKALKQRYTSITADQLLVRNGLLGECEIPLEQIEQIEPTQRKPKDDAKVIRKASFLEDLESHNICLHLKEKGKLRLPYGGEVSFDILCLFIDEKDRFCQKLQEAIALKKGSMDDHHAVGNKGLE